MSGSAASPLGAEALATALDVLPTPVAVFDRDWTIGYVNRAAARLLGRSVDELIGRDAWAALPELRGTRLQSFLLHARSVGTPVSWSGYHPPAGCWLEAAAVVVAGLLQLSARPVDGGSGEPPLDPGRIAGSTEDAARLRFLAEVSEAMIATLDTGESATRLAELASSRLCDWAFVALAGEDGGAGEEAWAHRDPARRADLDDYVAGRLRNTGDDAAMVEALLTGEPVQLTTIDQDLVAPSLPTDGVRAAWRRLYATSCTIVRLRARGQTFGARALLNSGGRPAHTEAEIAIAVEVARRGALALDNARLYGRQLKVAETLQHSLLSPPPQTDELEIAVRYRPAAVYQQVGGDWYDAFPQPDGGTLLVIGDVVGHDVDAAAAMGQIRSILRGIAYDRPESPAQVLARVDRVLDGLHVGTMATALVARIERPAQPARAGLRTLRWSSAGHLPPALLRPDGTVRLLDSAPERLLGAECTASRSNAEVTLHCGDTVVFYTDGLVEHGHSGIDDGLARLCAELAPLADVPVEELCDQLLDRIVTGRADDDIALLAVRARPREGRPSG